MQVVLHRQDSVKTEDKLATNSLSFKSINGSELRDFEDISSRYQDLLLVYNNISVLQRRLLNVLSNYKQAVTLMDGLYASLYMVGKPGSRTNATAEYNNITARINRDYQVQHPKMSHNQLEDL